VFDDGEVAATGSADPNWRAWRIENIRRSLAMIRPDALSGLRAEEATQLVGELQRVHRVLEDLRR
jgi:hypothetical protein